VLLSLFSDSFNFFLQLPLPIPIPSTPAGPQEVVVSLSEGTASVLAKVLYTVVYHFLCLVITHFFVTLRR
jgi:hypothetical protein